MAKEVRVQDWQSKVHIFKSHPIRWLHLFFSSPKFSWMAVFVISQLVWTTGLPPTCWNVNLFGYFCSLLLSFFCLLCKALDCQQWLFYPYEVILYFQFPVKDISWIFHNVFCLQNRPYSYEIADLSKINVMLNNNDVSDYLKISPTGLEVSNWFIYLFSGKIVLLLKFIMVEHQSRGSTVMNTGQARVAQWWERSPPTIVAEVQLPASTPYVGWVCCCSKRFFSGYSGFPLSSKTNTSKFQRVHMNIWTSMCFMGKQAIYNFLIFRHRISVESL